MAVSHVLKLEVTFRLKRKENYSILAAFASSKLMKDVTDDIKVNINMLYNKPNLWNIDGSR